MRNWNDSCSHYSCNSSIKYTVLNMGATIKRILLFLLFAVLGGLIGILVVFPDHFESFNDYQINVLDYSGRATTLYARGERTGLLGQHEAITISPENIASRKWSYDPGRDLRYDGEDYVLYKVENGVLYVYSQQILPNIDYSSWGIPVEQETLEKKKKNLIQENSQKNGYHIISTKGMTE